jgi:hypothetical protein
MGPSARLSAHVAVRPHGSHTVHAQPQHCIERSQVCALADGAGLRVCCRFALAASSIGALVPRLGQLCPILTAPAGTFSTLLPPPPPSPAPPLPAAPPSPPTPPTAPPAPPARPPPSPSPQAPPPPGQIVEQVAIVILPIAAPIDPSSPDGSNLRLALGGASGVPPASISITPLADALTALISLPSAADADAVAARLRAVLSTPASASTFLGVPVLATAVSRRAQLLPLPDPLPLPPPPSPPPPPLVNAGGALLTRLRPPPPPPSCACGGVTPETADSVCSVRSSTHSIPTLYLPLEPECADPSCPAPSMPGSLLRTPPRCVFFVTPSHPHGMAHDDTQTALCVCACVCRQPAIRTTAPSARVGWARASPLWALACMSLLVLRRRAAVRSRWAFSPRLTQCTSALPLPHGAGVLSAHNH